MYNYSNSWQFQKLQHIIICMIVYHCLYIKNSQISSLSSTSDVEDVINIKPAIHAYNGYMHMIGHWDRQNKHTIQHIVCLYTPAWECSWLPD